MLRIRPCQKADAEAFAACVNAAYRCDAGFARSWTSEKHLVDGERITAAEVEKKMADSKERLFVAESENAIVGTFAIVPEDETSAHISLLSVHPEFQRHGFGRALIWHAEQNANVSFLLLCVFEKRRELVEYYERRGYVRTGRRILFDEPGPHESIVAREQLYFVELKKEV